MRTEELRATREFRLLRTGRFLIAELLAPHRVLSTSSQQGGESESLRYLVNQQSCEGAGHREREAYITGMGLDRYHEAVCREIGLDAQLVASMGTAANMNYAAIREERDGDVCVTAVVTAGVQGNAACAGDAAGWRETESGWDKIPPAGGTINTMLFISHPLTRGALARAAVTMTEAKSAALTRLAIRSRYSKDPATGTGTDQYAIAAPLTRNVGKPLTSTSPHVKLGESIGVAVRDATSEALRWQNGLEPSYTRGLFHALGAYGLTEATFFEDIAPHLSPTDLELLQKNAKSVFYEPLAAAAAYAVASILDRVRYGTLPTATASEALRQQAALLAANLAARPDCWPDFLARLTDADPEQPARLVLRAIALGWSSKWT
ncbi:MAG TPA: adenosylcobinamide amidohydrolase [Bryobacteraceae bacterium]|nr:adenosylcobinamide amidohydrolase [Bryobacteraceae bacterium]